jgi:putative membrane protein
MSKDAPPTENESINLPGLAVRGGIGGVLMGLANLVPGISGGTMLLAAGVYPRFIEAIGEVTTLKFKRASLITLASIIAPAALAFVLLAGPVKDLVVDHRWVMYAIFIGLTLGGVPLVWRMITNPAPTDMPVHDASSDNAHGMHVAWIGAAIGFIAMASLALVQSGGAAEDVERGGLVFFFLAGVAGASAMILPGVSGGYLLLVLGVYVPILAGVSTFKDALPVLGEFDLATLTDLGLNLVLPVGVGAVVGVVVVSNLLRWLLHRYEKATLGVLLGLLVGAVVGLWPFQQSVEPQEGDLIKGQEVAYGNFIPDETYEGQPAWYYVETLTQVEEEDFPVDYFTPTGLQIAGAIGLIVLGLGTTLMIDRVQGGKE